jgi:predicted dehydrogenase
VGIIGRGFGKVVAGVYKDLDDCEVVEVVTPRDELAVARLCARDDIDLISIHSPPFLHLDNVKRAIEAGRAVVCDKPFGRQGADATEMARLAREAGVVNLIGFETRFDPVRQRVRALVQEGSVGEPDHVQVTYVMNLSRVPLRAYGWVFDAQLGGGWLRSVGSHQVDFVRWNFGEIVQASGQLRTVITERPDASGDLHKCTADDGFTALLGTATGVTAVIDSTYAAASNLTPRLVVIGSEAVLEVIAEDHIIRHSAAGQHEVFRDDTASDYTVRLRSNMHAFATLVRDAVHDGAVAPDLPTFADGLATVEVLDRIYGLKAAGDGNG